MELIGLSKLNEMLLSGKVEFKIEVDKMECGKTIVSVNGVELAGINRLVLDADDGIEIDLFVQENNTYGKHKLTFKPHYRLKEQPDIENSNIGETCEKQEISNGNSN